MFLSYISVSGCAADTYIRAGVMGSLVCQLFLLLRIKLIVVTYVHIEHQ